MLGLGVSHAPAVNAIGLGYAKPLTRMREYLDAMDATSYRAAPPSEPAPRVLAALAPKMLALARDRAQGAHPYLVTPEHTSLRARCSAKAPCSPRSSASFSSATARAGAAARRHLELYLALPNYRANWLRLGFEEADLADGGSDRLVDALVAWGDEPSRRAESRAHRRGGRPCGAAGAPGDDPVTGQLTRLAPALL